MMGDSSAAGEAVDEVSVGVDAAVDDGVAGDCAGAAQPATATAAASNKLVTFALIGE